MIIYKFHCQLTKKECSTNSPYAEGCFAYFVENLDKERVKKIQETAASEKCDCIEDCPIFIEKNRRTQFISKTKKEVADFDLMKHYEKHGSPNAP